MGQIQFYDRQDRFRKAGLERRAAIHAKQMQEVQASLEQLHMKFKVGEERLLENTKLREKKIRDQIEIVIKLEEDKVKARLEAEKRAQEEAEWKRKEERKLEEGEDRKGAEENKRKAEENKRKEEEAKWKKEEQEKEKLEEEQELLEQEKLRVQREESEKEQRKELGMSTTTDNWSPARTLLMVDIYPSPKFPTNCL